MSTRPSKSVPKSHKASFVYGSYPDTVHSPRIKPGAASTTYYGKDNTAPPKNGVAGAGFGNTGNTGES